MPGFHRSYEKTRDGPRWFVNRPATADDDCSYLGSRELQDYCEAAIGHVKKFLELIPQIQAELEK